MKLKLEVKAWSWSLKLKFEVEVWSWSLKLKFEVDSWACYFLSGTFWSCCCLYCITRRRLWKSKSPDAKTLRIFAKHMWNHHSQLSNIGSPHHIDGINVFFSVSVISLDDPIKVKLLLCHSQIQMKIIQVKVELSLCSITYTKWKEGLKWPSVVTQVHI